MNRTSKSILLATFIATLTVSAISAHAAPPKDLDKKVVLANPQKYAVTLRLGTNQRNIEPRKASVLSPSKYPLPLEFWSGKKEIGWTKTKVDSAGVYLFQWKGGTWSLVKKPAQAAPGKTTASTAKRSTNNYRRSTGSYNRTARPVVRRPYVRPRYVGGRWNSWVRGVWGLGRLYRFIRDEEDRDILREIIIGGEIDDAIREEIEDWLDDALVAVPHTERQEIERAIDDISKLNPDDWKEITTLPANEWDQLRDEIGEEIPDADWDGMGNWVDTLDEPVDGDVDLGDVGIDTMDENIDLASLDNAGGDFDLGLDSGDIDLGDISGSAESMDLSDFGDGGYQGGIDLSDLGLNTGGNLGADLGIGAGNLDVGSDFGGGNIGGGWDTGNIDTGGFDPGGYDPGFGGGGADWGGGTWGGGGDWGGGDWGGGGFGGGDFGGGFGGGDFGGGDFGGGDFGGDFGGGDFFD